MFGRLVSLILSAALPAAFLLQACGQPGVAPSPVQPGSTSLGAKITKEACESQGDQDSDGDGICDKDEAEDPTLGPKCVHNPDCNNNGNPDGDDPSWWVKHRYHVAMATIAGAASYWIVKRCFYGTGAGPGCDFNHSVQGKSLDGLDGPSGSTTPVIGKIVDGSSSLKLLHSNGSPFMHLFVRVKNERPITIGSVTLGTVHGFYLAGYVRDVGVSATASSVAKLSFRGDFAQSVTLLGRERQIPPENLENAITAWVKEKSGVGFFALVENGGAFNVKPLAAPDTITKMEATFSDVGRTSPAQFSLKSFDPKQQDLPILETYPFKAKELRNAPSFAPYPESSDPNIVATNPLLDFREGYPYWANRGSGEAPADCPISKAQPPNAPWKFNNPTSDCAMKDLFQPSLPNAELRFELLRP